MSEQTEYRRNEKAARREEREATIEANYHKIVSAVESIDREQKRANDKNDGERSFRKRIEIIVAAGIWVAAVVAVGAIYIGSRDAREQREVMSRQLAAMQNQLNEMRAVERAWIGPYDASMAAEPAVGEDLPIVVQYRVSGRLPASSLTSSAEAFVSEDNAGSL